MRLYGGRKNLDFLGGLKKKKRHRTEVGLALLGGFAFARKKRKYIKELDLVKNRTKGDHKRKRKKGDSLNPAITAKFYQGGVGGEGKRTYLTKKELGYSRGVYSTEF